MSACCEPFVDPPRQPALGDCMVRDYLPAGEMLLIPEFRQYIVFEEFLVDGDLVIEGKLFLEA